MAFADGIEEGKVMGINAVSTHAALTLYGFGYPVNDIAKATGLLATEIEELVSNLLSET